MDLTVFEDNELQLRICHFETHQFETFTKTIYSSIAFQYFL